MALDTGTAFIPCEENPYYRLATVHGVPDRNMSAESREELRDRNRVTWNRYFVQGLNSSKKVKLKTEGVPSDDIDTPLTVAEQQAIQQRLNGLEKPNYKETIDFSKVQFYLGLDMEGFVFANGADFRGAKFSGRAYFMGAKFSGRADFNGAKFSGYPNFARTKFSDYADFNGAKFSGSAHFPGAKFSGIADFKGAKFSSSAYFRGAKFSGDAYFIGAKFSDSAYFMGAKFSGNADFKEAKFSFEAIFTGAAKVEKLREFGGFVRFAGATFEQKADFTNRVFLNTTNFDQCEFITNVPNFAEAKLHQATTWRGVVWPSLPMIDKTEVKDDPNLDEATKIENPEEVSRNRTNRVGALVDVTFNLINGEEDQVDASLNLIYKVEDQVDAYRNLRLRMKQIENYQQEVFFLGKELDAKRRVHWLNKAYFRWFPSLVYKLFSDYGTSLARPVGGLLCLIASFGALVFWLTAREKAEALGMMEWVELGMQSLWFSARYALPLIGPIDEWNQAISQSLPSGILVFTVGQTILGVLFLFLIGLALRNRFRIR